MFSRQPINGEWLKGSQSQDNCGQLRFGFIKKNLPQAKKTKNNKKHFNIQIKFKIPGLVKLIKSFCVAWLVVALVLMKNINNLDLILNFKDLFRT